MSTITCFHGEIRKIFTWYPLLSRPMSMPSEKVRLEAHNLHVHFVHLQSHRHLCCLILQKYCIRPNYRTGRLGISEILVKLVVKYVSTCTYQGYTLKQDQKGLIWWCSCDFCFNIFLIKAYVVGTHLNCIDKSMQFKWVPTTYAFIKK